MTEEDPGSNPPDRFHVVQRIIVEGHILWIILHALDQWQETVFEGFNLDRHEVKCSLIYSINSENNSQQKGAHGAYLMSTGSVSLFTVLEVTELASAIDGKNVACANISVYEVMFVQDLET